MSELEFSKGNLTKLSTVIADDSKVDALPKTIGIYLHVSMPPLGQAAVLITDEEWPKLPQEFRDQWMLVGRMRYEPI